MDQPRSTTDQHVLRVHIDEEGFPLLTGSISIDDINLDSLSPRLSIVDDLSQDAVPDQPTVTLTIQARVVDSMVVTKNVDGKKHQEYVMVIAK